MSQSRKRKSNPKIPLERPKAPETPLEKPLVDISESEQWRIIKESGILKQIPTAPDGTPRATEGSDEEGKLSPCAEELFNATMLIIPMSFMLLLMDILVHHQYGRRPDYWQIFTQRLVPGIPILSIFIFYTLTAYKANRYKSVKWMQAAFFVVACVSGSRLVWLINRGNWLVVMQQSPPTATAWIYGVLQLDLLPSVVSLGGVVAYSYWNS
ncbi:uncharacterized protein BXZ73DRAFT_87476 [Epithele typhae]|uniref:uncharacterized protein n=1 Tax=Epithele typhae TaxID=378194 RepID=UPI0020082832|nr:uncharacterized protein BXZ73DRAFT_87476 [Epithele typhae]KAH9943040.1 hypothetical protein BXZ73DRAFT_87476 [Epithele typhae]